MSIKISMSRKGRAMSGSSRLSSFMASVATQIRAAIHVGVPGDDAVSRSHRTDENKQMADRSEAQRWDDSPGYMTRNGLGSLEVGAFRDRSDD